MIHKLNSIILPTAVQEHITLTVQRIQVMLIVLISLLVRVIMINKWQRRRMLVFKIYPLDILGRWSKSILLHLKWVSLVGKCRAWVGASSMWGKDASCGCLVKNLNWSLRSWGKALGYIITKLTFAMSTGHWWTISTSWSVTSWGKGRKDSTSVVRF